MQDTKEIKRNSVSRRGQRQENKVKKPNDDNKERG